MTGEREPVFADRDRFGVQGGCWCADTRTVAQLRHMGHDVRCTQARRGWEANYRHLAAIERERREDLRVGREVRAANSHSRPEQP